MKKKIGCGLDFFIDFVFFSIFRVIKLFRNDFMMFLDPKKSPLSFWPLIWWLDFK